MNINNRLVAPVSMAVDRFAGAINTQMISTGMITGRKPFLKSLITFCFLLNNLPRYMNKASIARSDVWNVRLINGSLIHRLPSLSLTPKNKVYTSNGIAKRYKIFDQREYSV